MCLLKSGGLRFKPRGFTLLELLIGFFIIGATSIIFFQTIHKFRSETIFYSEHFIASALLEKVLEQCYQETEINPYGITALGLSDLMGNPYPLETGVTDGQTILFRHPTINSTQNEVLHKMLKDNFSLSLETALDSSGFYRINARFNWNAAYGKGSSETWCRVLAFPGEKEVLTSLELSDEAVEQRLVQRVFAAPGTTLASNVSNFGAQELMMSIGHIYYALRDLFASSAFQQLLRDAEDLETGYSAGSAEFSRCTDMYFELARDLLHLMVVLKPRLENIQNNLSFLDLLSFRARLVVDGNLVRSAQLYRQLRRMFIVSLLKLSERYEQQLNHARTQREQRAMVSQIFNFYRVMYVTRDFSEEVITLEMGGQKIKTKYELFLSRMQTHFFDKDPAISRMAVQELGFLQNDELEVRYFLPSLLKELFAQIDTFAATNFY